MNTGQATLVLASLLRSGRRFQSHNLSKTVMARIAVVQEVLEEYGNKLSAADTNAAQLSLEQAYFLMNVKPPVGGTAGLEADMLAAVKKSDLLAEAEAWHTFLMECLDSEPDHKQLLVNRRSSLR